MMMKSFFFATIMLVVGYSAAFAAEPDDDGRRLSCEEASELAGKTSAKAAELEKVVEKKKAKAEKAAERAVRLAADAEKAVAAAEHRALIGDIADLRVQISELKKLATVLVAASRGGATAVSGRKIASWTARIVRMRAVADVLDRTSADAAYAREGVDLLGERADLLGDRVGVLGEGLDRLENRIRRMKLSPELGVGVSVDPRVWGLDGEIGFVGCGISRTCFQSSLRVGYAADDSRIWSAFSVGGRYRLNSRWALHGAAAVLAKYVYQDGRWLGTFGVYAGAVFELLEGFHLRAEVGAKGAETLPTGTRGFDPEFRFGAGWTL